MHLIQNTFLRQKTIRFSKKNEMVSGGDSEREKKMMNQHRSFYLVFKQRHRGGKDLRDGCLSIEGPGLRAESVFVNKIVLQSVLWYRLTVELSKSKQKLCGLESRK